MSSSDRIKLSIDPGTWNPMDEDMFSPDPIEWDKPYTEDEPSTEDEYESSTEDEYESSMEDNPSNEPSTEDKPSNEPSTEDKPYTEDKSSPEDEPSMEDEYESSPEDEPSTKDEYESSTEDGPYIDRLDFYQESTGLVEAVPTSTCQLNGIPVAIGIMDFQFLGGSMGSVVGEKITRLIEYGTNQLLPLIIVCASGGARMQEGSLSLMQMAKISSALYNYQINQKLLYVAILTSPTTGGVTASFGMLGDIIIVEPKAYLAFTGKRVIEQMLNKEVPEGSQSAEVFFEKGLLDSIVSRDSLKDFLSELFEFHGCFSWIENEN
ncbi:unnamed protein product [Vicia faba]|uniref:CoA carboxyltransferase N-terminal domain-containing protein n=1 Tax=Vicia faba TaxID=3906 RepID=A0AAV1A073_VICFA|nr:unnamed protein product [Vicia faba]